MKKITLLAALTVLLLTGACSNQPENNKAVVKGTITVADSVDSTGDFSGIGVTIVKRDSTNAPIDTLFRAMTDASGMFEGEATFPGKNYYPLIISRNDNDLASFNVILADNDTLDINAQLPDVRQTLSLDSREHEAMKTLNRVDRSFQRVGAFILGGAVPDSQIVDETKKWAELYWQVFEAHENTMASYLAAEQSAELLGNWAPDSMLARIDKALPADYMFSVALKLGKPYIANSKGFEAASGYIDSLIQISENEEVTEFIVRDKIQMYFDSSRIGEAKDLLDEYEQDYSDSPSSKKWIRRIRYDLNYLAPGVDAPDFSFVTMEGDTVNNQNLTGSTYIIEISPLANFEYQNDYDRTMVIGEIYKNYGLKIFTIPLDQSEVTVNAFFDERRKAWPVAKLGSFDVQDVIQKFNVVQVPTRILIDENGVVIRKYERNEFSEVIQGLNRAFSDSNSPS